MFKDLTFPVLLLFLILLRMPRSGAQAAGGSVVQTELWCVAKNNAEDAALQGALDWACGPGGADCGSIQQGGPCYDPSDIQKTASYAFNDYFLKHGMTDDACNFSNTAALTSLDPSRGSCKFPSSKTVSNASISGSTGLSPESTYFSGSNDSSFLPPFLLLITGHLVLVLLRRI
ncbi:hypothetical protein SLEP1_g48615 [Rubroshorea leprosula]|uniref:X8 domain-containing protein n=1 Tax=Rubroshorea leprosula TaxID=152421 RepID=A0AAV5LW43_9ROSI|nr:hypothetical protein SLEP1_g48615 [Rubroshorea leprosula]